MCIPVVVVVLLFLYATLGKQAGSGKNTIDFFTRGCQYYNMQLLSADLTHSCIIIWGTL